MATYILEMDEDLKKRADALFEDMGVSLTAVINSFVENVVEMGKLPYDMEYDENEPPYNAETLEAMRECDEMLRTGNYKRFSSTKDMIADILAGDDDEI
jgi:DNA-damage-inducible protein J